MSLASSFRGLSRERQGWNLSIKFTGQGSAAEPMHTVLLSAIQIYVLI